MSEGRRQEPNKFQLRRASTRGDLIRLGLERMRAKGFAATTIEDIVADTTYTRGAFYFHFASKEDFFIELLRERSRRRGDWWLMAEDPEIETLGQAVTKALGLFGPAAGDPASGGGWVVAIAEFTQSSRNDPAYRQALDAVYRQWIDELARFVAILQDRGLARRDLAADLLAAEIYATAEGHTLHAAIYGADGGHRVDAVTRVLAP